MWIGSALVKFAEAFPDSKLGVGTCGFGENTDIFR